MGAYVLAVDQGTTSTRSIIFDKTYRNCGSDQREIRQHFPKSGWVEHDPNDLWAATVETARNAIASAGIDATSIAAVGLTNQRETTIVWDRRTGEPVHDAIVWQDRRTADHCARLREEGACALVAEKTGLRIDAYFSATKIGWILDHVSGARQAAEAGHLAFGTVDSWLVYKLTGGRRHVTDITNASRTLLFDIGRAGWDNDLLSLFGIPEAMLPEVCDNLADFGVTDPAIFGVALPIRGMAGDQHAAMIGQACFQPGMIKATYGTGCFALLNTGTERVVCDNRILTTIAYKIGPEITYALEGSIFVAGAAVQWLRDGIAVIDRADQTAGLAESADATQSVYLVPAFTGLGAPWWDPHARAAMFGMTRSTGPAEFARAALESVCFQTRDLLHAMHERGSDRAQTVLRVDGGMARNDWAMQRLADILDLAADRAGSAEISALGAAWLAGNAAGIWPDQLAFSKELPSGKRFEPNMEQLARDRLCQGWAAAVRSTLDFTAALR